MARHFFLSPSQVQGSTVVFTDTDTRHFISLRLRAGDIITGIVLDETRDDKLMYTIKLQEAKKTFFGKILEIKTVSTHYQKKIHILQCIPKLDKMDLIIQKASELGVYEIVPLFSRFTDIQGHVGENKLTRWMTVSKEASIQSGRLDILYVQNPQHLKSFLEDSKTLYSPTSLRIFLNEQEKAQTIHDIEMNITNKLITDIYILTGAEGGFSNEEITLLQEKDFLSITLGKNILRAETSPIAVSAIMQYLLGTI